ncbi:RnfABCDGE type electron transport complex subunit D [Magnetococcales bacterium HHB-1]
MSQPSFEFSSSPHVHSGASVQGIMQAVIWALMPAATLSVLVFGLPALLVIVITTFSCMIIEWISNKLRSRPSSLGDRSAALTGLLLALTLPPHSPWWVCVVGAVFAIGVGKQVYGGLGFNLFNPALIARVFLLISFPVELTTWPEPSLLFGEGAYTLSQSMAIIFSGTYPASQTLDAITAATPLGQYQTAIGLGQTVSTALGGDYNFSYFNAGGGIIRGSLGETSFILLAAGGMYLLYKKIITWHIPVTTLLGCLVPALVLWLIDGDTYPDPIFHLVTGGLVLGAFFMATDMVTSPVTPKGQIIFGLGCGLLTYVIRTWAGYPEGISFAVVIMNTAVPLIDQYTRPVIYGQKPKKA